MSETHDLDGQLIAAQESEISKLRTQLAAAQAAMSNAIKYCQRHYDDLHARDCETEARIYIDIRNQLIVSRTAALDAAIAEAHKESSKHWLDEIAKLIEKHTAATKPLEDQLAAAQAVLKIKTDALNHLIDALHSSGYQIRQEDLDARAI